MAIYTNTNRRDHRNHACRANRVDNASVYGGWFADKAKIDIPFDMAIGVFVCAFHLGGGHEPAILARYAQRLTTGGSDPANQFLVNRTRQHHFGNLCGFSIGDAKAIDKFALHAQFLKHCANLRPAAMDDNGVDADGL